MSFVTRVLWRASIMAYMPLHILGDILKIEKEDNN